MSNQRQIVALYQKGGVDVMQNLWTTDDQRLTKGLNKDIVSGPTLAIPEPSQSFFIKIDCLKDIMVVVLLQVDESVETLNSEAQENSMESLKLKSTCKECAYNQFLLY